jgi:hypothetical protein
MTKNSLLSKTKAELLKLAEKLGLKRVRSLKKAALAAKIAEVSEKKEPTSAKTTRKTAAKSAKPAAQTKTRRIGAREKAAPAPVAVEAAPVPEEQRIEASKYEISPPPVPPRRFEEEYLGELPESYETGKLFLTARDPYWLYAYWDFSGRKLAEFRNASSDGRVILRLFESGASYPAQEITLTHDAREWYLHVGKANAAYHAELGYWRRDGGFEVVSRSRQTKTPPDALSGETTARFVTIPIQFTFRDLLHMILGQIRDGEQLADALHRLQAAGHKFPFDVGVGGTLTREQEDALRKVLGPDVLRRIQMGSIELSEWLRRRLLEEIGSGALPHSSAPRKTTAA